MTNQKQMVVKNKYQGKQEMPAHNMIKFLITLDSYSTFRAHQ